MLMSFVATKAMKPKQLFLLNTVLLFNVHYVMLVIFAFFPQYSISHLHINFSKTCYSISMKSNIALYIQCYNIIFICIYPNKLCSYCRY